MGDQNQDKKQNDHISDPDDELESLSPEERAAFEKIMAEITISNGDTPVDNEETTPPADTEDPPPPGSSEDVTTHPATAETATSPMAALPADSSETPPDSEESDDPQAALDKIMAEIGSKGEGADPDNPGESPADREPDAEPDMSEDQQAALDKIMAEIESKRKGADSDNPGESPAAPEPDAEPDMSEDQQVALDKIMSEIGSRKSRDLVDQADGPAIEASGTEKAAPLQSESLSMDEFDDELSQLLTADENDSPESPVGDPANGKPDDNKHRLPHPPSASVGRSLTEIDADLERIRQGHTVGQADPATMPGNSKTEMGKDADTVYPVLHEVKADSKRSDTPQKGRKKRSAQRVSIKHRLPGIKSRWLSLAAALGLMVISAGAYWIYRDPAVVPPDGAHTSAIPSPPTSAPESGQQDPRATRTGTAAVADASPAPAVVPPPELTASQSRASAAPTFGDLQRQLAAARDELQNKISDIQQLKSFYAGGIVQEMEKIENALEHDKIPSFEQATGNTTIELALRSIQRRDTYITKLDTPLTQLGAMSEELLYLERRARVYETLSRGIHGLPIDAFHQEVQSTIAGHLQYNAQLSIDQVDVQPKPLAAIWKSVSSEIGKKANLLAQRAPLNRAIGAEICNGNFDRQSLLTALSPETARCLIKWNGKDLYLNDLTELTPEVADLLSQWPGEWLSLNGIKALPDESARHLSQWPGKRISLNGLSELSPAATAHLSQWQGAQLEMVGLVRIGRWENYGTRLFLSEKLKKQLEAQ